MTWASWASWASVVVIIGVASCGGNSSSAGTRSCPRVGEADYRHQEEFNCPSPRKVTAAEHRSSWAVGEESSLFAPWTVIMLDAEVFEVQGQAALGWMDVVLREIWIADSESQQEALLSHELFHAALYDAEGDPDAGHSDPRWAAEGP